MFQAADGGWLPAADFTLVKNDYSNETIEFDNKTIEAVS